MRTAIYVDGFNLFHRLLQRKNHLKWLDLFALTRNALRTENDVVMIRYFTARVTNTDADPAKSLRQDVYLRALTASGVLIHYGVFRERQRRARLVETTTESEASYVKVWSREEKGSDVNLAVHLINDAWSDQYDCAVVITNDSDLAEALRLVRSMGKIVGLLSPVPNPTPDLQRHADFVRLIKASHLIRAQLPRSISLGDGRSVTCPEVWARAANDGAPEPSAEAILVR
ncbi:MAG: NYN domain-containing protein [Luteibacter sp.]